MLKLNKLLYKSGADSDVFLNRISPHPTKRTYLVGCKNKIRDHLKPQIRQATKEILGMERVVEPRFRTQGSWSYDTCNEPAFTPPQEMDWDYGVYLPVTVWEENGPPHLMAKTYFELVERLLKSLCQKEGWTLLSGKDTCIRIQVASWAHIDLPLYAAPEAEFIKIRERITMESASLKKALDFADFSESYGDEQQQAWADLDRVVMATRKGEWKPSDPEVIARWFGDRVDESGEQLRRVCRYLKAWRDVQWQNGGPSSVSLMIAAVQNFTENPGRDDLALESVATHLADVFLLDLRELGIDNGAEDFNRLTEIEREDASQRLQKLAGSLKNSRMLGVHLKDQAIRQLAQLLGHRVPDDANLVEPDTGAAGIRTISPTRVPPPVIPSTSAG